MAKELEQQNKQLLQTTEKIDEARATKLAQVPDRSKFAVMGTLETSSVYTGTGQTKRYRVLDETGKTICYVTPTGPAVNTDFSKLIGHKVGLVGKIEPHEATRQGLHRIHRDRPARVSNRLESTLQGCGLLIRQKKRSRAKDGATSFFILNRQDCHPERSEGSGRDLEETLVPRPVSFTFGSG